MSAVIRDNTRRATAPRALQTERLAFAAWIGLIWIGIVAGFGSDFPRFLRERPPAPLLVHVHAVVFLGWLVLLSVQAWLVLNGRIAVHRRMGWLALAWMPLMAVLGLATALTVEARSAAAGGEAQFLAVNFVDIAGFLILAAAGLALRRRPDSHRRLMVLATVALSDPGFGRVSEIFLTEPTTFWAWFGYSFYGDVLLIGAMGAWDLWYRRRIYVAWAAGAVLLVASEILATVLYFSPAWKNLATEIARAWPYRG
jgi:hypothetical protein